MAKPPVPSPERAALALAHQQRANAQADLADAEAAHEAARRAYGRARGEASEIEDRIAAVANTRTYVWQQRAEISDKIAEAHVALEAANDH
jgi:predicted  nucleic acid-binding Zn-ribbon protein